MRTVSLFAAVLLLSFCMHSRAYAALTPAALQEVLEQRVASGANRCLQAALVTKEGIQYLTACQEDVAEAGRPDKGAIFELGSVSKVFTGVLLASASLRGEVELEDTVAGLLPDLSKPAASPLEDITLLELATHTSGLPRMPGNWTVKNTAAPYAHFGEDLLLQALVQKEQNGGERGVYGYSNYGMGLLGYLLGRIAKESYGQLLRQRIARPLQMQDTFEEPDAEALARLVQGHDSSLQPVPPWTFDVLAGCGAVDSTARDMAVFLQANLGYVQAPEPLGEALQLAREPLRPGPAEHVKMGLGWHILELGEKRIVFHDGGTGGHRAFVGFCPGEGTGVVLLSDTSTDISDIGLHALEPRLELQPPLVVLQLSAEKLQEYAGRYRFEPEDGEEQVVELRPEGEGLRYIVVKPEGVSGAQESKTMLLPVKEDVFVFATTRDAAVRFERDEKGRVSGLGIAVAGQEAQAERLP